MKRQDGFIGVVICVVIVILFILANIYYVKGTEHTETFKLNKAERVVSRGGQDAKYLLFTDKGTFENTDSWLNGKFNSSDLYGQFEPGKSYTCKVYGWRIPIMSQYPNVVSCENG